MEPWKAMPLDEIITELEIARDATGDEAYKKALQKAIDALMEYMIQKEGEPL